MTIFYQTLSVFWWNSVAVNINLRHIDLNFLFKVVVVVLVS